MNLYLDDDSAQRYVVRLLQQHGHDVETPAEGGKSGEPDPVHLRHAILGGRVLLTHDHDHFKMLHDLVLAAGGHHPGILVVRRENDPTRDLSPRGIVRAIGKLLDSGIALADGFHILNHWR